MNTNGPSLLKAIFYSYEASSAFGHLNSKPFKSLQLLPCQRVLPPITKIMGFTVKLKPHVLKLLHLDQLEHRGFFFFNLFDVGGRVFIFKIRKNKEILVRQRKLLSHF